MKIGTQVAYIPAHAAGDVFHPDVEFGFVTGTAGAPNTVFCRYWHQGKIGIELRTTANSEATSITDLVSYICVQQNIVDNLLIELGYKNDNN